MWARNLEPDTKGLVWSRPIGGASPGALGDQEGFRRTCCATLLLTSNLNSHPVTTQQPASGPQLHQDIRDLVHIWPRTE